MKLKTKLLAVICGALLSGGALAQLAPPLMATPNEVYLEQIGNSNDTDITQIGVSNIIRGFGGPFSNAILSGNTNVIHIEQTGDNTLSQYAIYGSTSSYNSRITGNLNTIKFKAGTGLASVSTLYAREVINGTANEVTQTVTANSVRTEVLLEGNLNDVITTLSSNNGVTLVETLVGSINNGVEIEQLDSAGANGHSSQVSIQGAANSVLLQQQGTNDTSVNVKITGDLNVVTVRSSSTAILNSRTAVPR